MDAATREPPDAAAGRLPTAGAFWRQLRAGQWAKNLLAGGAAAGIEVSRWLLSFSPYLFLTLALLKRFAECRQPARDPRRPYRPADAALLSTCGRAAELPAVAVLALYIRHAEGLWTLCPPWAWWIGRLWLLARRGRLAGDPLAFVLRGPPGYAATAAGGALFALAL
jgi:hypothetical protein